MTNSLLPDRPLTGSELLSIDCLTAALLTAGYLTASLSTVQTGAGTTRATSLTSGIIVLCMGLPIAVRRLRPMPVFLTVSAASVLALPLGVVHEPFLAASLAGYTAARTRAHLVDRRGWTILIGTSLLLLLLSFASGAVNPLSAQFGIIVPGLALVTAAWIFGAAVRERRAHAIWRSDARIAQAIGDERLRVAREVHDIVTHNLGVITVKAAVARQVGETQPSEMLDALRTIEEVGRAALTEMRQVLLVVRAGAQDASPDSAAHLPLGACDLDALQLSATAAGLDLHWKVTGTHLLPAGAATSTYRILQEALTNVVKHAGPTLCDVTVDCTEDEVVIDVENDGAPDQPPTGRLLSTTGGYGLIGMRERVAMYGGELTTGHRRSGGFQVHVRLPYRSPTRSSGPSW